MVEKIKEILRAIPPNGEVRRADVAKAVGADLFGDGGAFSRDFETARNELWGEQILFTSRRGGRYERRDPSEMAEVAIAQSRQKAKKGLASLRRARAVIEAAPLESADERTKKAVERQADRAELMAARVQGLRRQRRFEEV